MEGWAKGGEAREIVTTLKACLAALSPPSGHRAGDADCKAGASVCTVGLMLNGCTIDDTMPGSPSFLSGQFKSGDVIETVDGKAVTLDTLVEAIRGSDLPGSKMEMQLRSHDRTLKTVCLLRQPRVQVLARRDLVLMIDELRSVASSQIMEQRGKKKPDEPLLRFLNKSVEDLTTSIRKVTEFEGAAQTKERELREYIERVNAVTRQYLGRLEHALREEEVEGGAERIKCEDGEHDGKEKNPRSTSQSLRFSEMEKRAADAEAALHVQQQAHAAVMLRMQAEVQSLQDQLAFARAVGEEPAPSNADDVTLSSQLSRAKTKLAKLEAELSVAKESLHAKNAAISATRLEAQAAVDAGKAEREALKACREALAQSQQELKRLQHHMDAARVGGMGMVEAGGGTSGSVGAAAVVASLESQVAQLTKEVVAATARVAAAEKKAGQAQEEARILLRKRQADQSALAQVEADVMSVLTSETHTLSHDTPHAAPPVDKSKAGSTNSGNPQTQEAHLLAGGGQEEQEAGKAAGAVGVAEGACDDTSQNPSNPSTNADKHKYEAAIIKIGGLQQKVAELQNVIKSYQKEGKTGVLEMQSAARSATEARKELEAERQRRNEERTQLTGQLEQVRQELQGKLAVAEKACAKLKALLGKKEAQLDRVSEEAQKAATMMKEEMNSLQARHEAAWQRTADAVDRLESDTREAQAQRDAAVKARAVQEERMAFLESEAARLEKLAASAEEEAQKKINVMKEAVEAELEGKENACAAVVHEKEVETGMKVAGLQEQLRAAHDSVADAYAMVSEAQATCVREVEAARSKESAMRSEARGAQEALKEELRKIQRHLAGVTGIKDAEIERLQTRVETQEMTVKTRNAEAVTLQLEIERVSQHLEQERQRREAAEGDLEHARLRLTQCDDKVEMARQNAAEAEERIRVRERQLLDDMRAEMQEEGLLEVRLQEAREETARLAAANEALRADINKGPAAKMHTELLALRAQVAALEQDLHTARSQLHTLRESEAARSDKMRSLMGEAGGALSKDLSDLLALKLGRAQLEAAVEEARDESASAIAALEAANSIHSEHIASLHAAEANRDAALKSQAQALRAEADEVRRELELKAQLLSQALDRAAEAEHQVHGLRSRIAALEKDVHDESRKRRQELDALLADIAQMQRDAQEKQRELADEATHWKEAAQQGDFGKVNRLQEHLDQLRETAEEEVATLSMKLKTLERERRDAVARLESELAEQQAASTAAASTHHSKLQAAEQRTKEKDTALRRLQKQVATFEDALRDAGGEIDELRNKVALLQREKGKATLEATSSNALLSGLHAHAEAAKDEALQQLADQAAKSEASAASEASGAPKPPAATKNFSFFGMRK